MENPHSCPGSLHKPIQHKMHPQLFATHPNILVRVRQFILKHPKTIETPLQHSKHPKTFETSQNIRNTPKKFETRPKHSKRGRNIQNTPKHSKHRNSIRNTRTIFEWTRTDGHERRAIMKKTGSYGKDWQLWKRQAVMKMTGIKHLKARFFTNTGRTCITHVIRHTKHL